MTKNLFTYWRIARLAALAAFASCSAHPAKYADADPVVHAGDDAPIELPPRTELPSWARYSDAYIRGSVVGALDPSRTPYAGDVNSMDEVPRSSWFDPERPPLLDAYAVGGAPELPLSYTEPPEADEVRNEVTDARDLAWLLVEDAPGEGLLRTGSGVIGSRLAHALGYHVAEAHLTTSPAGRRALAIRYPAANTYGATRSQTAIEIGPTHATGTRDQDANDVVPHEERRTLRALGMVATWLGLDQIRPSLLRDVYVGEPKTGFLQHQLVGFEDALGAGYLISEIEDRKSDAPQRTWIALATLGFGPTEEIDLVPDPDLSRMALPFAVNPWEYKLSVVFMPAESALGGDLYWIAKRIASIPDGTIATAVEAAELSVPTAAYLRKALERRRNLVARFGMSRVTPVELAFAPSTVLQPKQGSLELQLVDEAVRRQLAPRGERYVVEIVDVEGEIVMSEFPAVIDGAQVLVRVPVSAIEGRDYAVVRVRSVRGGVEAPRPAEIHLRASGGGFRVRGVRH